MKKKTVKILMGVALISTLLGACSTNRSTQNEQKTLNTEISKIVKNHSESTYEENTKENTEKVVEKNTEDNLYLTTDYKVEDYCNGYFIVSKMDGRLFGVINSKGKEVIPLKYDEVSFYNRQEVEQQGADTLLFQASYQDEDYLLDTEGKEFDSEMEIKPLLGKIDSSIKYYSRPLNMKYVDKEYTNGDVEYASGNGEINFYDKNKSKVGTFSTGYPIIEYYQLTKDYYLIDSYEGINDYHVYLNNKDNTTIWDGYAISHSLRVNIIDNNVLISVNTPGDEKIYCLASDGSISEVTGYYTDYTGIHKGQSENRPRYTIGKDDNIKIKSYDDTWLLEGDDIEICNDRYFALDPISSEGSVCRYFFLKNSDSKVVLLDADANIIDTNDLFTWGNDYEPSLKGSCISDDKETVPWVKNGLSNTDCFLQSMYAGIVQSDTFKSYIDKRDAVFKDANNITSKNLYEVTQYCYAYLKSCYITRDAAVGALTEKTKEDNPTYESTQKMVNQEIAKCLVKLKDADKTNKYGCYGFLPENNKQYLSEYDDGKLLKCVVSSVDGEELYKDVLDMYYYKIKNQNWTDNDEVSPLFSNPYTNLKSLNNVGYALIDIDGNGVPELLIGDNESVSDGVIIDLYTYIDDSIVYLDTSGERYGIKLSKNGRIYRYGSGGAGLTEVEECKIDMDNQKLTTVEGVLYDEDDAKDTPWFYGEGDEYSNSNGYDISKMKNITEEEGMNKWDEYSNNIKGYTISFFSNYTPKKSKEDIDAGIYEEFIKNGDYNNYLTSDWEYGMPSQYAVLDIDGNGVDELIIYGNENEWGNIIVFTYKGDTQEIVPIQANLYDTGDTSRKTNVIWFCKNMEYSPQYHALAFTDSHYGVGNEDYLYYTINNDVFDIAFDVSAFTNYNTGDIQYSKGGINVERNDISESDYEAYINELKPIEWKKLP